MECENTKFTLLAVLAHPDDETFGMGGTLAYYARHGVCVHLVCATRGEVGEADEKYMVGYKSVADMRVDELHCAAQKLGLAGVHYLGYRDSGMPGSEDNHNPQALAAQPLEKVALDVVQYIRRLKPQVVITFDPAGGYMHPDHIAIQKAATMAFNMAGNPGLNGDLPPYQPQRLYYHTMPRSFLRFLVRVMPLVGVNPRKFGRNKDIDMKAVAEMSFPTHIRIDYRPVAAIRDEAAKCHASQGGGLMSSGIGGWLRRRFASYEAFMQAYPPPVEGIIKNDLFDGVTS
jgi:LmbE family N-acetylglucosaminyl deacetylase